MDFKNYTIKAQQLVQAAQNLAVGNDHQQVDGLHLLKAILAEDENVMPYLLQKLSINTKRLNEVLDAEFKRIPSVQGGQLSLTQDANKTLVKAKHYLEAFNDEYVSVEHLLLSLLENGGKVKQIMQDAGFQKKDLIAAIKELKQGDRVTSNTDEGSYRSLEKFAINLVDAAAKGKIDPVIGRDDEIRRVLQILTRRTKNNPLLIGEPGVGKTAVAEGIAQRIFKGDVPENLQSKKLYSLDMGALVAGAKYKGEFEERLKSVVKEVVKSDGEIILFIDEIHTLVGAGGGEGAMDAANILKPALARGELRAVGATTLNEYQKYFEKDKALERRFQKVLIDEPSREDAISILRGIKEKYEAHHKVMLKDDALIAAVDLSQRYITDRQLPDKAIDLIDEAASKLRMEINSKPEALDELDRKIMQLEIERQAIKRENDKAKLEALKNELAELHENRNEIAAKWEVEKEVVETVQSAKEEIEKLKLEAENAEREGLYEKVAEIRYGLIKQAEEKLADAKAKMTEMDAGTKLIKEEVDAEEIAEVISKWTGIPVSKMLESDKSKLLKLEDRLRKRVVGQEAALIAVADAVRRSRSGLQDERKPIGSFLFLGTTGVGKTELAKALSEFLFNDESAMTRIDMSEYQERHSVSRLVGSPPGYVGYDEGGQLTEAVRRKPYSVILLDEIEKAHPDVFNTLLQVLDDGRLTDNKGRLVNFKNTIVIMTSNLGAEIIQENFEDYSEKDAESIYDLTKTQVFELLKKSLRPEFLNRIDETIMFRPLDKATVKDIVKIHIAALQNKLQEQGVTLELAEEGLNWLTEHGYEPQFGARPIKRLIQKEVLNQLAKSLLAGDISREEPIVLDAFDGRLVFRKGVSEGIN